MHQKLRWLWPLSVVLLCCIPLFIGLGRTDLGNDEAIYSFGVDQILATGDWLVPKSSPSTTIPFLEKPPLKFWIVAAPIRFGLLPSNEFGLRFWDPLFGSVAFLYVFWIGRRVSTGLAGAVAVLILFVHEPLVMLHGLRSNNMEAALLLSYCGGMAHYLAWLSADRPRARRAHAIAVALFFVLGFMTKFVAAIFLPLVLGLVTCFAPVARRCFFEEWGIWARAAALALALILPWFVFAQWRFGAELWQKMVNQHVYQRFTSFLDAGHVQPWSFYFVEIAKVFAASGTAWLVGCGLVLMVVETVRRKSAEGLLVLLWALLPLCLISIGTSKLYHYAYPFLPPLAIAGGVLTSRAFETVRGLLVLTARRADDYLTRRLVPMLPAIDRSGVHALLLVVGVCTLALAAATFLYGPIRLNAGSFVVKNSGVWRPLAVGVVCVLLGRGLRFAAPVVAVLLLWMVMPWSVYAQEFSSLGIERHPMRTARDCLRSVEARESTPRGLFVDLPAEVLRHPIFYYFLPIRPWIQADWAPPSGLAAYMYDPVDVRPALAERKTYDAFARAHGADPVTRMRPIPQTIGMMDEILLVLPEPYAACGPLAQGYGVNTAGSR